MCDRAIGTDDFIFGIINLQLPPIWSRLRLFVSFSNVGHCMIFHAQMRVGEEIFNLMRQFFESNVKCRISFDKSFHRNHRYVSFVDSGRYHLKVDNSRFPFAADTGSLRLKYKIKGLLFRLIFSYSSKELRNSFAVLKIFSSDTQAEHRSLDNGRNKAAKLHLGCEMRIFPNDWLTSCSFDLIQ